MFMTAKVDFKKGLLILAGVAAVILALILILGRDSTPTASIPTTPKAAGNDGRLQFLKDFGWEVSETPAESGQVRIPDEDSAVFDRYNLLQKGQGYDLKEYSGKKVMRYVYKVTNFPGATDPVYATVLVYKNKIIGGDVTNTSPNGHIQGFRMNKAAPSRSEPTQPISSPTQPTAAPTQASEATAAVPSV